MVEILVIGPGRGNLNYELAKVHKALALFYTALFVLLCIYFGAMNPAAFWSDFGAPAVLFGTIVFLHFAASKGVESARWWGRAISVLLGTILLVGFPIGTAIGGYLLYLSLGAWERPQSNAAPA